MVSSSILFILFEQFFINFTAYLSIFKPSSFYILISTSFGIKLMVQVSPVMQVFVSADPSLSGTTAGTSSYCVIFLNM